MNIFWGYEDFVDMFWGSSQNLVILSVISMHFRVFFKGQGTDLGYSFGLLKVQIFLGCLKFLIYFWGEL